MNLTGHAPSCVCGSCSSIREDCKWPRQRDKKGHFIPGERFGHNWLPVRGNLLHCAHCGQDAVFGITKPDADGLFATVTLVG